MPQKLGWRFLTDGHKNNAGNEMPLVRSIAKFVLPPIDFKMLKQSVKKFKSGSIVAFLKEF